MFELGEENFRNRKGKTQSPAKPLTPTQTSTRPILSRGPTLSLTRGPASGPARSRSAAFTRGPRARGSTARRSSPQTRCPFPHRQHGPTLSGSPSSFRARATNPEIPGPVISPAFLIGCARWDPGAPFKPPRSPSGNPTSPPHQTPNPGRLCSATHNPCAAVD